MLLWVFQLLSTALLCEMASLLAAPAPLVLVLDYSFPEDEEVRFMGTQTQHDQVSVCSINAVRDVGVVVVLSSLASDEVKDLVLSFAWDGGVREDYLERVPQV